MNNIEWGKIIPVIALFLIAVWQEIVIYRQSKKIKRDDIILADLRKNFKDMTDCTDILRQQDLDFVKNTIKEKIRAAGMRGGKTLTPAGVLKEVLKDMKKLGVTE
ncbi:MAG: hypothetical protein ACTSW1_08460 [Candidatus Hodarchaeales archaeon]